MRKFWIDCVSLLAIKVSNPSILRSGFGYDHGSYVRWLLILLCAHMEEIRHLDLSKAFGYIEKVKFEKKSEHNYFTSYGRNML